MTVVPVTEWLPDSADLGNKGSVQIVNALPGTNSYKPFPAHSPLTDALDARPRGAIDVRDKVGTVYQYAGDAGKIYSLSGTSWADVSLSGGYSTASDERWEFVAWKNKVLATNYTDNPQTLELGGSNFTNLTTAFKFRRIATIRDHVITANTFDSTDGEKPDRVRWSAFNDETDWTVSPTTGADYRDLNGGAIQRLFGGEYGVILGRNSTWRIDWVGAPTWFQINETVPGVGVLAPGAAARIGNKIYSWSGQGFVAIESGTGYQPIGAGKVDRFAFMDLDDSYLDRITAVSDPKGGRIFWAYPGTGNSGGRPNKILCYDVNFARWSIIETEVDLLWQAGGVGFTLEQLDTFSASLDALTASLDSSQWKGDGAILLAGFDSAFKHGFFQGSPMQGIVESREMEFFPGQNTMLVAFRPLVDGGSFTAQVGSRKSLSDDVNWTGVLTPRSSGKVTKRSNSRYHRLKAILSGEWCDVMGFRIEDARRAGSRG